ncbi:hypothetical protein LG302_18850 [Halomonas organivorans]
MLIRERARPATFAILLLGGALLLPAGALADHHEDAMQQGDSMEQDAMAGEAMTGEAMTGEAMGEELPMKPEDDDAMPMEEEGEAMEGEGEM